MRLAFVCGSVLAAAMTCTAPAGVSDCPADINNDGIVDAIDYLNLIADWGCTGATCPGDINGDQVTDAIDFLALIADWGCASVIEPMGTLSGTVTNAWTGTPIVGASVSVSGQVVMTDGAGNYTGDFPAALHEVVIEATNFNSLTDSIVLFPDISTMLDAALDPVAAVIIDIQVPADSNPGDSVQAMAVVEIFDGSTIQDYAWMQTEGAPAAISGADTDTATVDLGTPGDYKAHLFEVLTEPPIGEDQLPPNVPLPPGEFPAGLQNRWEVVPIDPFALERTGAIGLEVMVTTTSGTYSAHEEVHSHLPWAVNAGIRNLPINVPVLMHGKEQATYDWALTQQPASSVAVLTDATTNAPEFTPDWPGLYELTVMDLNEGAPVTIELWAGNWRGVIVGQDAEGLPVSDTDCTSCHSTLGFDQFDEWSQSGHARIFSDNLDTRSYYNEGCFSCHTVGYNTDGENNGMDDSFDYDDFLAAGLIGNPGDNWTTMLDQFPWTAQVSNIQCENCHGPQEGLFGVNTGAHGPVQPQGEPRISLSSGVCATCHGEPLRHARYQQWQLSGHANYEVAIDESQSGSCSRCHTANGFLEWLPVLLGDEPGDPNDSITVTWTEDEAHPQTCVACHDPHAPGTTSGIPTDATVRISDNTPPLIAGFQAFGVGRGAICMTCHNSRRGLRNDTNFDDFYGTSEATRAPHGSSQADVLMGENAYFVTTGIPGDHSFVTDTCVKCHMEETLPPDDLAYNQGGTNHTFYASVGICSQCHTGIDGESVQTGFGDMLDVLQHEIEAALLAYIGEITGVGNIVDLNGEAQITDVASVASIEFTEFRGRQAMILTLTDMSVLGPYRMGDVDILDGAMQFVEGFYDSADPNLIKAGWNWALVHNDGSLGVHNPAYSYWLLNSAITSLNPAAAQMLDLPDWAIEARGELFGKKK